MKRETALLEPLTNRAEHGLGSMKTAEGARYKSEVELTAQRAIRRALDPKRIMNPRVLF